MYKNRFYLFSHEKLLCFCQSNFRWEKSKSYAFTFFPYAPVCQYLFLVFFSVVFSGLVLFFSTRYFLSLLFFVLPFSVFHQKNYLLFSFYSLLLLHPLS